MSGDQSQTCGVTSRHQHYSLPPPCTHLQENKGSHVGMKGVGYCGEMCFLVSLADCGDTKPDV